MKKDYYGTRVEWHGGLDSYLDYLSRSKYATSKKSENFNIGTKKLELRTHSGMEKNFGISYNHCFGWEDQQKLINPTVERLLDYHHIEDKGLRSQVLGILSSISSVREFSKVELEKDHYGELVEVVHKKLGVDILVGEKKVKFESNNVSPRYDLKLTTTIEGVEDKYNSDSPFYKAISILATRLFYCQVNEDGFQPYQIGDLSKLVTIDISAEMWWNWIRNDLNLELCTNVTKIKFLDMKSFE